MMQQPLFTVGNVPVYGDAILSPMAGYSDVPYRALCRAYGSAMHYTEFVPVEALLGKRVHERFRRRLDTQPGEHPMVFQIFGNNAQMLLDAALRIQEWGPDIIDINMGCSTRKVSGRGAGVGILAQPSLVEATITMISPPIISGSHRRIKALQSPIAATGTTMPIMVVMRQRTIRVAIMSHCIMLHCKQVIPVLSVRKRVNQVNYIKRRLGI